MSAGVNSPKEKLVKSIILNAALNYAIKAACLAVPFLNLPIIHQLFTFVATQFVGKVYEYLARVVKFEVIDFEEEQKQIAFEKAKEELAKQIDALPEIPEKETELDEETKAKIKAASDAFDKAFDNVVSMPKAA